MRKRLIIVVPLTILLVLVVERIKPPTAESELSSSRRFWIMKTHSTEKYSCVICGDSRVYRGMSPREIERHLDGITAYNLGYSSGSYSNFMLDRMEGRLDKSKTPNILMLGITPSSLTPKAALDRQIRQELARKKEEIFESLYLQPLQEFFEPYEIKWSKGDKPPDDYEQEFFRNGWVASDKPVHDPNAALPDYKTGFIDNMVSRAIIDTLMTRIQVWRKQGIIVVGVRPPTTTQMEDLERELGGFDEDIFAKRFREAGGIWLDVPLEGYSTYDGSHLDKKSAIEFSAKVGEKLREIVRGAER